MAAALKGNCYLCGAELGKTAMKNHLLKEHATEPGGQACYVVKVEGAYDKNYWLYIDVPKDKSFSSIDTFLRKIWLECCGHMSGFHGAGKSRKLGEFMVGDTFMHEYDYGSTTETSLAIVGESTRKPQKGAVRLLARNVPPQFKCAICGKEADAICVECSWEAENPFYCDTCKGSHEHEEMMLPVTNSPRMGECGYCGELDDFEFDPAKVSK